MKQSFLFLASFYLACCCSSFSKEVSLPLKAQENLSTGITLFTPQGYNPTKTPSLAFEKPLVSSRARFQKYEGTLIPRFFYHDDAVVASMKVPHGSSLYGTGEVKGPLLRNGKKIALWNTDNAGYKKKGKGNRLYQSHPWVLGVRPDGTAFGVLFDSTWKAILTTTSSEIRFENEGAPFRVLIIEKESPQAVVQALAELTGKIALPPKWALGFQQCRYSYHPDVKVKAIAEEYRKRHLPCDVLWMDIDYMNGYRIFTFNPHEFPNPKELNNYLHERGFHSVWMIDPGVKVDPHYVVYQEGRKKKLWVETQGKKSYEGDVWPGTCVFPDFTMPATRQWWSQLYINFMSQGIDGVWNDMNEPAIFHTPSGTMPEDNWHRGGGALPAGIHRLYHNVYGMLMVSATRDGILKANPDVRPFVLTRANYLGGQRYAATWTGDNGARWSYLKMAVPMTLNLGLSGQPFSGPDLGGFREKTTPELFGQWIVMAPFFPFARAHTDKKNLPREPWVFGPRIEAIARTALERRYRLLPYLYTQFFTASKTGMPIMQPLFFADPHDLRLRTEDRAFLYGPDLLVIPQWAWGAKLPRGIWRPISLINLKQEADGFQPFLKIRGGAIVPLGRIIQNTNEESLRPLTLLVCLDEKGEASGILYEDQGNGFEYQQGNYALTRYHAKREGENVIVTKTERQGTYPIADRNIKVEVITAEGVFKGEGQESKGVKIGIRSPNGYKTP
ncbi:MAG: TIM-barrel domain-containing protein [Chthoniobacterales bacterium]